MFENTFIQPDSDNKRDNTQENKDVEKKDSNAQMTRRGFLKMATIFSAGVVIGHKADIVKETVTSISNKITGQVENSFAKDVEDDFWLSVIETVSRQKGEKITPQDIRAHLITKLFNIPQGWTSGLNTRRVKKIDGTLEQERLTPELDRLVAEYFTNRSVIMDETFAGPLVSFDIRDFKNAGENIENFGKEVKQLENGSEMGLKIYQIIKSEYEHLQQIQKQNAELEVVPLENQDCGITFAYLPGGVPLFFRGYAHGKDWQKFHGDHLAKTYSKADYVGIEGGGALMGERLKSYWSAEWDQNGHYDQLMKGLVEKGFDGFFFDIDDRQNEKVILGSYFNEKGNLSSIYLPDEFYQSYFDYLQKESPRLAKKIGNLENLKILLWRQDYADAHPIKRSFDGKDIIAPVSVINKYDSSLLPTGNELGEIFVDALSALKMHIMAVKMNEGIIQKGIIVDFEGSYHLPLKSFFIKNPQYATEVVLRSIHMLMSEYGNAEPLTWKERQAGKNRSENLQEVYRKLKSPDWERILYEIGRIPMAKVENNPEKTVHLGSNQKTIKMDDTLNRAEGVFSNIDQDILIALFDDKYIQSRIKSTKK